MLVTLHISTSLRNCAGYIISACTKNVQETSLGSPLYVFCSAGNSTFCPVPVFETKLNVAYHHPKKLK